MDPKVALVTGGSGEIGAAICEELAAMGAHVIIHTKSRVSRAREQVARIEANGGSASIVQFDITDQAETQKKLAELVERQTIQILVNNAGIHDDAILAGMDAEQWHKVINVSLNGFFHVTQPLLLPMIRMRWGRIINIASVAGVIGNRGQSNYAAAKAGLIGASKSLALELASRGITVNVVAPGVIEGKMTRDVFDAERVRQLVPMGRMGDCQEVAGAVGFLASEKASYVSGQVIGVNGAMA